MAKEKSQRGGARGKLRAHFLANIGRVMDSDELRAVADNQSEWARRDRELRTELIGQSVKRWQMHDPEAAAAWLASNAR